MSELAEATGCSFLIIEHALKKSSQMAGDPLSAIGGQGSGLPAAARMAYLLGKDPKDADRRILAPLKSNLREKPKALAFETDAVELDLVGNVPFLIQQGETDINAGMLLAKSSDQTPGRPPTKRAEAAEWLTKLLYSKGKLKAKTVFEDAVFQGSISSKTLRRAADDLGVIKTPPGGGHDCVWELPPKMIKAIKVAEKRKADKAKARKGQK